MLSPILSACGITHLESSLIAGGHSVVARIEVGEGIYGPAEHRAINQNLE